MRQIVYISTAGGDVRPDDLQEILTVSQANNARDGITGLLYSDGKRFLQAIEGEEGPVQRALTRIRADARHRAIVLLSDRSIGAREFGTWSMAERRPGEDADRFLAQVSALVAQASPNVRATFEGLVAVRAAT